MSHFAYLSHIAYMHYIVFGLGCQTKHEVWGVFVLKVTKYASILGRRHSWSQHDRVCSIHLFSLHSFNIDSHTWPLWPSCIKMCDWRPEGRGPYSLESITCWGGWACNILLLNSMPCTVCPLLQQNQCPAWRNGRSATCSADRPPISSRLHHSWSRTLFPWPVVCSLGRWHP